MLEAARAAFSWRIAFSLLGVFGFIGVLSWLGSHSDPRYRSSCADPSDFAFVMFFLSLPIIGSCALVGLGECVLWGRERERRPALARHHRRRAMLLLAIAALCCGGVAIGFMGLCRFF